MQSLDAVLLQLDCHYNAFISEFTLLHLPVFVLAMVGLTLVCLTPMKGTGMPEIFFAIVICV